jgi:glycosyltransferase involved in cell wall biosynthesis
MTTRILAIVEAKTVTGPAKNLIRFASNNSDRLAFHFLTYARTQAEAEAERHTSVFIDEARKAGIPVCVLWERSRFDKNVLEALVRRIRSLQPQLVQTHSVKSHFLFSRVRRSIGVPWIAFHHGYTDEDLKMRLLNRLDRFSLPKASAVVTVCQAFARDIQKYGIPPERTHVLHNSLDMSWANRPGVAEEAAQLRTSLTADREVPVLLCVGRFSKEKGHSILLEAVELLKVSLEKQKKPSAFKLLLIGDGLLRRSLEQQVRDRRLEHSVEFVGQQHDVRPYFAAADVLVLPSLSEGSPNVLLEAMSARLPVVVTDVGGVREIVSDGETALLVPPNRPAELAEALERLLENAELRDRLSASARRRLVEHFSPAKYDQRLFEIYDSQLKRAASLSGMVTQ